MCIARWDARWLLTLGDCLKVLFPCRSVCLGFTCPWIALIGLAAFLGHVYGLPRLQGGKGLQRLLGSFCSFSLAVLGALAVFSLVLFKWRFVSLASISAAAVVPSLVALIDKRPEIVGMSIVIAALVIWKHRENIKRLKQGTENRFRA
jgi:glycerol-3-phosphate acyltransferase PlsY